MSGPVGIVGSDESTLSMVDFDRELLAATGRDRPRIAIVALALPVHVDDPPAEPQPLASAERFRALGAEVEPVYIEHPPSGQRRSAPLDASLQAIGEADIIYLAGGARGLLSRALLATPLGAAVVDGHRRGVIVVGCSAAAMLLGGRHPVMRRRLLPTPVRWGAALDLLPDVVVLPAYDARPEPVMAALALLASRRSTVLGIDRDTAIIGRDGSMRVYGRGRVTVWRGRHRERFRRGDTFRL